jgi:hypothetical protein
MPDPAGHEFDGLRNVLSDIIKNLKAPIEDVDYQ